MLVKYVNFVSSNWKTFAPFAYQNFLEKGKGVVLVDYSNGKFDYIVAAECASMGVQKLIETYNAEQTAVIVVKAENEPYQTISFQPEEESNTPKVLYQR